MHFGKFIFIALFFALIGLSSCGEKEPQPESTPNPITNNSNPPNLPIPADEARPFDGNWRVLRINTIAVRPIPADVAVYDDYELPSLRHFTRNANSIHLKMAVTTGQFILRLRNAQGQSTLTLPLNTKDRGHKHLALDLDCTSPVETDRETLEPWFNNFMRYTFPLQIPQINTRSAIVRWCNFLNGIYDYTILLDRINLIRIHEPIIQIEAIID